MPKRSNLYPVHNTLQPVVSGTTAYTTFYGDTASQGFITTAPVASGVTAYGSSQFKGFGYQYLTLGITHTLGPDVVPVNDAWQINVTTYFQDNIGVLDSENNGNSAFTDVIPVNDAWLMQATTYFTELAPVLDSLLSLRTIEEDIAVRDEWLINVITFFQEGVNSSDAGVAFRSTDSYDSLTLQVEAGYQSDDQLTIEVTSPSDFEDALIIQTIPWFPTLTAHVTGIGTGGDQFLQMPSVHYGKPHILKTGVTAQAYCLTIADGPLPTGFATVYDYSVNLDSGGGTWSVTSDSPIAALGATCNIFGLTGFCTASKRQVSSSNNNYVTSGIFGDPLLNKPFNLLAAGNPYLFTFLTNPQAQIAAYQKFGTFSGAAQAIAGLAQCNLTWSLPDIPFWNTQFSEGQTAMSALSSLAATAGGVLRWDGGNNYIACKPTQSFGGFALTNSNLYLSGSGESLYDLTYGTAGLGLFGGIQYTSNPGPLPTSTDLPPIQTVYTTAKVFGANDPTLPVPVPLDSTEAFIQILTKDGPGSDATSESVEGNTNGVTSNPNVWSSIGSASITSNFHPSTDLNGNYQLVIDVNKAFFPDITAVTNNNFVLKLGVRRATPAAAYLEQAELAQSLAYQQAVKQVGQWKYPKGYSANMSSIYTGTLPLPGMAISDISICGATVNGGIIDTVSLTPPGILTIQCSQFATLDLTQNLVLFEFSALAVPTVIPLFANGAIVVTP